MPFLKKPVAAGIVEKNIKKSALIIRQHWWVGLSAVAVVSIFVGGYSYWQHEKSKAIMGDTIAATQIEQQKLIEAVSKHIKLPQNEQPSVATVSDIGKLQGQPFFANAKNGDKVLIYEKAQKAILYDTQANIIIEVGPVDMGKITPALSPAPSSVAPSEPLKVAVYNGTTIGGLASQVEKQLTTLENLKLEVIAKGNASKSTYSETLIVDINSTHADTASSLANELHGQVSTLPEGEHNPANVDIVIILGKK